RGLPRPGRHVGAPARVPLVRPRRVLRLLARPARVAALPRDRASADDVGRARRDVGVVLRGPRGDLAVSGAGPHVDREQAFPRLSRAWVARLALIGRERRLADGEALWEEGAADVPFHVVLEGGIAILSGDVEVVVHGPGNFSGDVDLLSDRASAVAARA